MFVLFSACNSSHLLMLFLHAAQVMAWLFLSCFIYIYICLWGFACLSSCLLADLVPISFNSGWFSNLWSKVDWWLLTGYGPEGANWDIREPHHLPLYRCFSDLGDHPRFLTFLPLVHASYFRKRVEVAGSSGNNGGICFYCGSS